jgi:hypothetical protein
MADVFTNKFDGLHAIVTSLRLPNGTPLPSVIALNAERASCRVLARSVRRSATPSRRSRMSTCAPDSAHVDTI